MLWKSRSFSSRYISAWFQRSTIERVKVRVTTGDDYCKSRGIDRIAMLKVDVEGMDHEELAGFKTMLQERRVSVVQFEYGLGYIGARRYLKDVCALLSGHGYDVLRQFPDGLKTYAYREEDEDFRGRNFVALVKDEKTGSPAPNSSWLPASVSSNAEVRT